MTPEVTPGLTVPDAGLLPPPSHGAHTKKVAKRKSSEAERSVASRGAASVVDVFTEMGNNGRARAGREARLENISAPNRADRLQVSWSPPEVELTT